MDCSIGGCNSSSFCKGMCTKHYQRVHTYGSPEAMNRREDGMGTIHRGYLIVTVNGKQTPLHRYLMEMWIGRNLLPNEQVHHINGDKLNNRIENLKIVTPQAHPKEHAKGYHAHNGSSATHKYCFKCDMVKPRSEFAQTKFPSWCTFCTRHYYHKFVKTCPLCN